MPAVSKKQQRFFGIVRAIQKGEMAPTTPETAKAAADMKKSDVKDFASTKHKKLPEKKVTKEGWSDKYKKSIDCNNPKGFSQRAHCQGKKKVSESTKYDKYDKEKKQFAKADNRMKFGKFYDKAKEARDRLRPGEVKKWDPVKKKYVSNKD